MSKKSALHFFWWAYLLLSECKECQIYFVQLYYWYLPAFCGLMRILKPGVHLIVTITAIAEKMCQRSQRLNGHTTVDDHSDRDRWNRIRFYSSDRLSDRNDCNDHMDTHQRSWTIRAIVIFPKVHCCTGSFHADSDFAPKNMILEVFWTTGTIKWTWLGDRSAIAEIDCFWTIIAIVTIKWTPGFSHLSHTELWIQ